MNVLFDFDGTIADSFDAVLAIANRLAVNFGYPITPPETVEYLRQLGSREVLQVVQVSPFKLPFLLRRLRAELNQEITQLKPFPGIPEALADLKNQGHSLGIATSNSVENVRLFLQANHLSNHFDFLASGLTIFGKSRILRQMIRQEDILSQQVIYVGDETRDIEAAHQLKLPVIAVAWGFNSVETLRRHNPDYLAKSPQDLPAIVASHQGLDKVTYKKKN
ncbi:MAG TPA: HAD-IA family hydrolase [Coleofasciculaceae cyanobacterium]